MKKTATCVAICFFALIGIADAETLFSANAYLEGTVVFAKSGVQRPLDVDLGLGMTNLAKSGRWGWYTELSAATPLTEFAPAPRLISGPTFKVSKHWWLTPVGLYQFNPPYGDAALSHTVGAGVLASVEVIKDTVSLGVVIGGGLTLGTPNLDPGVTIAPNVTINLPPL